MQRMLMCTFAPVDVAVSHQDRICACLPTYLLLTPHARGFVGAGLPGSVWYSVYISISNSPEDGLGKVSGIGSYFSPQRSM